MRKRRFAAIAIALTLVIGATSAYIFRSDIRSVLDAISGADFDGEGTGTVLLTIEPGDSGEAVARKLVDVGVTKEFSFTYKRILAANSQFVPGTFELRKGMSADKALALIADPASLQITRVTINEGLRLEQVLKKLSDATLIPLEQFQTAVKKPQKFGLPASLPNMDGYLFPATYDLSKDTTATEIIQTMVDRMRVELKKFGVSAADQHKVLTLASVVQREARATEDFYKVARVFQNRLDSNMPLQSCATISYFTGGSSFVNTAAERATKNPYNTYLYPGLPIGPIGAPGSVAIDAALHPATGSWLYFVAVNLETGETAFSNTYSEHLQAVSRWDAWLRQNPEWIGK